MTFAEQVEESVNLDRSSLVTLLLFPVGLRYHGLHHLFPSLPYHALGEAHRRLMNALPEDSPYRRTCCPGFFTALRDLLRGARLAAKRGDDPMQLFSGAIQMMPKYTHQAPRKSPSVADFTEPTHPITTRDPPDYKWSGWFVD